MTTSDWTHLEILAEADQLFDRLQSWAECPSPWPPMNQSRALIQRLLSRVEQLRIRLEAPLVVATFGGTGTGKSAVVNALVGQDCSRSSRERPTTTKPVLIVHPQTELAALGLPDEDFHIVRVNTDILKDIVIIDCPDPDTTEEEIPGSNLAQLHRLLSHCDVLIYTSTQQKYRSACVQEELGQAVAGCRLLFVQTHADLDEDIRTDWRKQLSTIYAVPEIYFVDSLRALKEQVAGQHPTGDFGRLVDLLTSGLPLSRRIQIRRANLLDLISDALKHCQQRIDDNWSQISELELALDNQRQQLTASMAEHLQQELQRSSNSWERRLLTAVTEQWGMSPFSTLLRCYNGFGNMMASFSLFRARNSAQVALIGAIQGARWWKSRHEERSAEEQLKRLGDLGLNDATLREAQLVISGYYQSANLDMNLEEQNNLFQLRKEAARVEGHFLGDATRRVDELIAQLASRSAGWFTRWRYEILFCSYLIFILFRVGKNFFWDTFLAPFIYAEQTERIELFTMDFYISAGLFFVLWSGLLLMAFLQRLRRGLQREIDILSQELAASRLSEGLFPALEHLCQQLIRQRQQLENLIETTKALQHRIATTPEFGNRTIGENSTTSERLPENGHGLSTPIDSAVR